MDNYNVNIAVGDIIRRFREGRKMSQEEFAELCQISTAYYGRIERGEHSMTLDKAQKIASALNIRLVDLFVDLPE